MSPPLFPSLNGLGWSVHKTPTWSTRVAKHVSGREVRASYYSTPLWAFELTFPFLTDRSPTDDLRTLAGFFLQVQGQFAPFLFQDPTDDQAAGQVIAIGDGLTSAFPMVRSFGGFVEPVGAVIGTPTIYLGGVAQSEGWSIVGNLLNFATAPAAGVTISADFTFAFLCRFLEDTQNFENFFYQLWELKSCKFRSIKP